MRVQSIGVILVALLIFDTVDVSQCTGKKINTDFLNLLSSNTNVKSSQDAIQSVLTLLEDLQGANEEAQEKADQTFTKFESSILTDISDFSGIVNVNSKSVSEAQTDLDAIVLKVTQTSDYLNWNEKRFTSNEQKLETLAEQRCEANSLFIDTLREYKNAISVLTWVQNSMKEKEGTSLVQKSEMGEYAEKLSKYANLFEQQAYTDFVKLGNEDKEFSQLRSTTDNESLGEQIVQDIVGKIQALDEQLHDAIKGLEEQEIKSANDFADFKTNLLAEQQSLKQEYDAKAKFLNSLQNDKELANDILVKKAEILQNGQTILTLTQDQYNDKKSTYEAEKEKRHEENQLLEEALLIYREKITTVNEFLKKRVNEYVGDASLVEENVQIKKQDPVKMRKGRMMIDE